MSFKLSRYVIGQKKGGVQRKPDNAILSINAVPKDTAIPEIISDRTLIRCAMPNLYGVQSSVIAFPKDDYTRGHIRELFG